MILNDGLNVLAPNGFGVDPDPAEGTEEVAAPKRGRRVKTPATAPTATTPEEAEAGPADSSEAAETTTDTATDTTTEETE